MSNSTHAHTYRDTNAVAMGDSTGAAPADEVSNRRLVEQIVIPIACFSAIVLIHVRYIKVRCKLLACVCVPLPSSL